MSSKVKSLIRSVVLFLLPRYPFCSALTLLLLLAERATNEKYPPFDPKAVYVHIGLLFLCAVGMGFKGLRCLSAVVHALHLLCFASVIYFTDRLGYRWWVQVRMANRMFGVAGVFLLYAYFSDLKPRQNKMLKRSGEVIIGIYVLIATYMVLQSPEDKEAFLRFVPGHQGALFVYATLLGAVALCYLPGQYIYDLTVVLLVMLTLSTCLIDTQLNYWTKRRGLHYWNQMRLLADNFAVIGGTILYLSCSKKKISENKVE